MRTILSQKATLSEISGADAWDREAEKGPETRERKRDREERGIVHVKEKVTINRLQSDERLKSFESREVKDHREVHSNCAELSWCEDDMEDEGFVF
jgi:hypothetical protein